jgi:hypothetical protein
LYDQTLPATALSAMPQDGVRLHTYIKEKNLQQVMACRSRPRVPALALS